METTNKNKRLSFIESLIWCFSNQSFKGRSRRSEFWWFTLFFTCLSITISLLQKYLYESPTPFKQILGWTLVAILLISSYCQLTVTFRRLHDIGKTGWWAGILALLSLIGNYVRTFIEEDTGTIINLIFTILFFIIIVGFCSVDSQKDENKYGISPKYNLSYNKEYIKKNCFIGKLIVSLFTSIIGGIGAILAVIGILIAPCVFIGLGCLLASWICNIDPNETYSWYSGLWHGIFFIPNLIRSWFGDTLYKAELYTSAYNVFWWLTLTGIVPILVFRGIATLFFGIISNRL